MASLLLLLFRSFLAGCALAIVWWLLAGRRMRLPGNVAAACLVAGLVALAGQLAALVIPASPLWSPSLPPGLISRLVESRFRSSRPSGPPSPRSPPRCLAAPCSPPSSERSCGRAWRSRPFRLADAPR